VLNVNFNLDNVQMNGIQIRMARVGVRWGVRDLAKKAGLTANTVTRIENGADAKQSTIDKLKRALEAAGIEFTNGDQPGVRLTKAAAARAANPPASTAISKSDRSKTGKATAPKR
jgi:transcriptional regulator with XRE-family HTH domain